MPFPDDPDDDAGFIPPLPQDDRLWRHPSEMAGPNAPSSPPHHRRSSKTGLIAFIALGLIMSAAGLAAIGGFSSSGPSQPSTTFAIGPAADALPETALSSIAPAIVQITIDRPTASVVVTGLIIRADGHVVTASDPIEGARSITVRTSDGRAYNATVVGIDAADDLAVIDIEGSGLPTPTFGDVASVDQGDTVFVIGRTESDPRSWVAAGVFQSVGMRLETADGTSMHGMIGSSIDAKPPTESAVLCTPAGEVIGLLTSRSPAALRSAYSDSPASTLALPRISNSFAHSVTWTRHVADDIIDTGSVHHGWLGVMTTDAPEGGASVESVAATSPAERAGLRSGDRITSLGDSKLQNSSDLVVALREHTANELVVISYVRDGISAKTSAKLSDRS